MQPKQELGIPEMVKRALMRDGWICRQTIIWHKPNPMPESVRDRCTKAHEYVFLLSKSARYWFYADAIAEPGVTDDRPRSNWAERRIKEPLRRADPGYSGHVTRTATLASTAGRNRRSVWTIPSQPFSQSHFATMPLKLAELCIKAGCPEGGTVLDPFAGAGTTGLVADRLQRDAVLIELNPDYAEMARARIHGDCPLFTEAGD